ncbi:MAG: glycosyltransferase [Cyanobacteria bacterium P01_D01_bin.105]
MANIQSSVGTEDNQSARVLIWSLRNVQNFVYNSCLFELEDVIEDVDEANVLTPPQYNSTGTFIKRVIEYKTRRTGAFSLTKVNPYVGGIELHYDYQIYFVVLDFPWYFTSVNLLKNWRRRCRFAVCYMIELWSAEIPMMKNFMDFFNQFDLICTATYHIVDELQEISDVPCLFVPPGIDTLKFCPDFDGVNTEESRTIDVCSLGRGFPVTNEALLKKSQEDESFFYYHELTNGSVLRVDDHRAHRTLVSNILKRSRYFITNYAKANLPELIDGQHEIGYRFFEGAAAGNVLIGAPPLENLFGKSGLFFNWEDSIIPIELDEPNIIDIIAELDAQPERVERIRRNNVANSLLQHDWVYRWEQILEKLELPIPQAVEDRKKLLKQKAEALLPAAAVAS